VRWNSHVLRYEDGPGDFVTAVLDDGTKIEGDVLVAADGWRSKVREQAAPQLAPAPLTPTRVMSVAGHVVLRPEEQITTDDVDGTNRANALLREATQSLVRLNATRGTSLLLFVYRGEPGTAAKTAERLLLWSLSAPLSDPAAAGLGASDPAEAVANACALLRSTMSRPDDAVALISQTKPDCVMTGCVTSLHVVHSLRVP